MNFKQLSGKQRLRLLTAAICLLLIAGYQYGIRNTIAVYRAYKRNYLPEAVLQQKMEQYRQLTAKEKEINRFIYTTAPNDTVNTERLLLEQVTNLCNQYNLKLKNYSPYNQYEQEQIYVTTSLVTVEGSFKALLRFVNELENSQLPARMISMSYKSVADNQQDVLHLSADIYLQQLQLINKNTNAIHP